MEIPANFCRSKATKHSSSQANGRFEVTATCQRGQVQFSSISYDEKGSRKNLILCDWSAPTWSEAKKQAVKKVLHELFKQAFPIYVSCKKRGLMPIKHEADIELLFDRHENFYEQYLEHPTKDILPLSDTQFESLTKNEGFEITDCVRLDYFELQHLIEEYKTDDYVK